MVQFKVSSIYGEPRASVDFSRAMVPIVQGLFQILLWSFLATSKHQSMYLFFFLNSRLKLCCSGAIYLLFVIFRPSLWCMITVLSWNWLEDLFFTHHSYVDKAVIECRCLSLFVFTGEFCGLTVNRPGMVCLCAIILMLNLVFLHTHLFSSEDLSSCSCTVL
jgi:hypothetical protein